MDWIDASVAHRERGYVCVAASTRSWSADEDPELREAVLGASLTVPDGQPLVWAMSALGTGCPTRVYGPELMARYCERAARHRHARCTSTAGATRARSSSSRCNLRQRYPGLRIVGGYSPPYRDR